MKRIDKEPTIANVIDSLKTNPVGRNQDVKDFLKTLDLIEGGYSIFINGPWGNGKTFFVKEVSAVMRLKAESILEPEGVGEISELQDFADLELKHSYLPIYYNAWRNDCDIDPVLSIMKVLVSEYDQLADMSAIKQSVGEKASKVIEGILGFGPLIGTISGLFGMPIPIPDASQAFENGININKNESYIDDLKTDDDAKQALNEMLSELLKGKADRLVLFVDELDRCRPLFALKVLERIKFLFDSDEVITVFSVDEKMLAHTVEGCYGQGFNGRKYLSRFYDLSVNLTPVNSSKYSTNLGMIDRVNAPNSAAHALLKKHFVTMRDCHRIYQVMDRIAEKNSQEYCGRGSLVELLRSCFAPILAIMRIVDPRGYSKTIDEKDAETMWEFANCRFFTSWLDTFIEHNKRDFTAMIDADIQIEDHHSRFIFVFLIILDPDRFEEEYGEKARQYYRLSDELSCLDFIDKVTSELS